MKLLLSLCIATLIGMCITTYTEASDGLAIVIGLLSGMSGGLAGTIWEEKKK